MVFCTLIYTIDDPLEMEDADKDDAGAMMHVRRMRDI